MEEAKGEKRRSLQELLDKLALTKQGEALYSAFVEALEEIPDRDVKSDVCLNTVKYQATQNAGERAKDPEDEVELAALFEDEIQRFSKDLLEMPAKFREWLKAKKEREDAGVGVSLVEVIFGSCDCVYCRRRRAANAYVNPEPSEAPTEPPPPPDVTQN